MKKLSTLLLLLSFLFVINSCQSKTGTVGNVHPSDISYYKDSRTNLCFAVIGAKEGVDLLNESTSIGMACVPCDSVKHLLNY